jgi:uncharacterized GH25 family protein
VTPTKTGILIATCALLVLFVSMARAHLSWIRLPEPPLAVGVPTELSLDHGDVFPVSEDSLPIDHVTARVIGPDGFEASLALTEEESRLTCRCVPPAEGMYVFSYIYDPGVMSKTLEGWRIGGKDEYPKAFDRLRGIQTAVAYIRTAAGAWGEIRPLGLPLELVPTAIDEHLTLTLLKDSAPFAGAEILFLPAQEEARVVGRTDEAGRVETTLPDGFAGEALFGVKIKLPMPADFEFDRDVFFTTLCLDFRSGPASRGDP